MQPPLELTPCFFSLGSTLRGHAVIFGIESDEWGPEIFYGIAYLWVLITLAVRRRNDMGRKGNVVLLWWLAAPSTSETSE